MRNNVHKSRMTLTELIFLLIGLILLFALARIATGQTQTPGPSTLKAAAQIQQPLYREYRGVRLGMTAAEARMKLGEPALKTDEQDFFVITPTETAQIAYNGSQRVITISSDYAGGVGAPEYRNVVGEGMLLERPDGSRFRMVMYDSERFWVSYNKTATTVPIVTITIGAYK